MNRHELWLWLWYFLGAFLYMIKRAFYQMSPPNVVANSVGQYIQRAGIPLLFRFASESVFFWIAFSPALIDKLFNLMGWQSYAWVIELVTQYAPVAFIAGLALDPMADWFIPTVIGRIPGLKDFWPQMPGPLQPTVHGG